MDFSLKEFEDLQKFKIKNSINDVPMIANHFFCYKTKCVLLKECRGNFTVYCSPQCHQVALVPMKTFDICYQSKNYEDALNFFNKAVFDVVSLTTRSLFI